MIPFMNRLPDELLLLIFSQNILWNKHRLIFLEVCQRWRRIVGDRSLWQGQFLNEQEAAQLYEVLPEDMPLYLEVTNPGSLPRPLIRFLLRRTARLKWRSLQPMIKFLGLKDKCPHLTHLSVRVKQPDNLSLILRHLKTQLKVLFVESASLEKGLFFEVALGQCTQLTHLNLTHVELCRGYRIFPHLHRLIYFSSYDGNARVGLNVLTHVGAQLRYFFMDTPASPAYLEVWGTALDQHVLQRFDIRFQEFLHHQAMPILIPVVRATIQETLKIHYEGASVTPLLCRNESCHSYARGGWIDFDDIDEAI